MAKGYTNKNEIESFTLQQIASSFDEQVERWIGQIETYIENFTGRVFIADTTASEKVYDGCGKAEQTFDEFVEVTKVELGEDTKTEVESDNYRTYPNNRTNKNTIQLKYNYYSKGPQNVTITAKWGYSVAVPDDIKFATTILVAGIMNFSSDIEGTIRSESIGSYNVQYKDEKDWMDFDRAKDILQHYVKYGNF